MRHIAVIDIGKTNAKVLLTPHPKGPEAWYDSTIESIYGGTGLESSSDFGTTFNHMIDELVWHRLLQDTMDHREAAIARYAMRSAQIRRLLTIPGAGLLSAATFVAVVDDVMTTGATFNEVARTLKQAGAARVTRDRATDRVFGAVLDRGDQCQRWPVETAEQNEPWALTRQEDNASNERHDSRRHIDQEQPVP